MKYTTTCYRLVFLVSFLCGGNISLAKGHLQPEVTSLLAGGILLGMIGCEKYNGTTVKKLPLTKRQQVARGLQTSLVSFIALDGLWQLKTDIAKFNLKTLNRKQTIPGLFRTCAYTLLFRQYSKWIISIFQNKPITIDV